MNVSVVPTIANAPGREHEHHPSVHRREQRERVVVADALAPMAMRRALLPRTALRDAAGPADEVERSDGVAPRAGRVDDHGGAHVDRVPGQLVVDARPRDASVVRGERTHRRVVEDDRPHFRRADRVGQREARVVGGRVVVEGAAAQSGRREAGLAREHAARAQPRVAPHVAKQRQRVVRGESEAELPARNPRARVHGPRERERPHEVRRDVQQTPPLGARLEHEADLPVLEIAHAAVDEPRRAARRAAREIALLDGGRPSVRARPPRARSRIP